MENDDNSNEQEIENESESDEQLIINESESEEEEIQPKTQIQQQKEQINPIITTINQTEPPLKEDKEVNQIDNTNLTLLFPKEDKEIKSEIKESSLRDQPQIKIEQHIPIVVPPIKVKEMPSDTNISTNINSSKQPKIINKPKTTDNKQQKQHKQSPSSISNHNKEQLQEAPKSPQSNNNHNYKEKTIFTKLSEEMYQQMLSSNSKGKDIYSYDAFIKDEYLSVYSEKFNRENNAIIRDFVDRSTKVSQRKKMGFNNAKGNSTRSKNTSYYVEKNKDKSKEMLSTQDNYKHNIKTPRSTNQFINDQDAHNKKRQAKLNELKDKYTQAIEKLSYPIPIIDSNSIEISNKKRNNSAQKDYNVHNKLYEENNRKKKEYALRTNINNKSRSSSQNKQETQGNINRLVKKLYDDAKERCQKTQANERSKSKKEYKFNLRDLANNTSNNLIMNKLIQQYDNVLYNHFQVKKEDNINITYKDFVTILYELHFTIKNFSHCDTSLEKEYQLTKDAWKVLTRKKENATDIKIASNFILLFLLNVCNLYKGKETVPKLIDNAEENNKSNTIPPKNHNTLIKKNLPFINEDEYFFESLLSNQIAIFFRLFNDNRRHSQLLQKEIITASRISRQEQQNRNYTFKPRTNSHKNYLADRYLNKIHSENNLNGHKKKLTLCNTYNVIQLKRERTLEKLRKEQRKEILKECTFYPNNKRPLTRSVSAEVSNRLYTKEKRRQPKPKLNQTEDDIDGKTNECTFAPQLTEYKQNMFKKNPIKKDCLVQNGIERYEKARIDRKLKDYLLSQGYHSLNRLKTSEEVIKDITRSEMMKDFHFELEKKNDKDTFGKYNSTKQFKTCKSKNLLFTFEIKIDDTIKTLLFYQGDNIIMKADAFCKENNLQQDSKDQIIAAMKDKVNNK